MDLSPEFTRRLTEIGFMAGGYGLIPQAQAIFSALQALRPDSEYPLVGLALNHIHSGKPGEAVKILQDHALVKQPDSATARAFLGMALHLSGHAQAAERELRRVLELDSDPEATALARSLLESS